MLDDAEKIMNLRNYYDKLIKILKNESSFEMFGKAFFDKKRIDDALCCIDANLPDELKSFRTKYEGVNSAVKTFKLYKQLIASIKNKPPMGTSSYLVRVEEALRILEQLKRVAMPDLKYIQANFPNI